MANAKASRSIDGATVNQQQHTIVLSAEHAQLASSGVRGLIYDDLEDRPEPWLNAGPVTVEQLERHAADTQAIIDRYAPAIRQFERQEVIDDYSAWLEGHKPPITGDITLTWGVADLERLAAFLTADFWIDGRGTDHENRDEWDRRAPVARAILDQIGRGSDG